MTSQGNPVEALAEAKRHLRAALTQLDRDTEAAAYDEVLHALQVLTQATDGSWHYGGTATAPEPGGAGDEAKVEAELAALDGERLPWRHKVTRLVRWLRRR